MASDGMGRHNAGPGHGCVCRGVTGLLVVQGTAAEC